MRGSEVLRGWMRGAKRTLGRREVFSIAWLGVFSKSAEAVRPGPGPKCKSSVRVATELSLLSG